TGADIVLRGDGWIIEDDLFADELVPLSYGSAARIQERGPFSNRPALTCGWMHDGEILPSLDLVGRRYEVTHKPMEAAHYVSYTIVNHGGCYSDGGIQRRIEGRP